MPFFSPLSSLLFPDQTPLKFLGPLKPTHKLHEEHRLHDHAREARRRASSDRVLSTGPRRHTPWGQLTCVLTTCAPCLGGPRRPSSPAAPGSGSLVCPPSLCGVHTTPSMLHPRPSKAVSLRHDSSRAAFRVPPSVACLHPPNTVRLWGVCLTAPSLCTPTRLTSLGFLQWNPEGPA